MRRLGIVPSGALLVGLLVAGTFAPRALAVPSSEPFEIVPGSFQVTPSSVQAGFHENLTTSFDFAHQPNGETHNDVRTIVVNLPAGFVASSTAVPTCTPAQLLSHAQGISQLPACPIASQVGQVSFEVSNIRPGAPPGQITAPVYNMETSSFGVAAQLGFKTVIITQLLDVSVRPGDSGLTVTTPNIPQREIRNIKVIVWGDPAAHEHDAQRGETCGEEFEVPALCKNLYGGPQEAHIPVKPFLSDPTSCESFTATMEADSWEEPEKWSRQSTVVGPIGECERVPFDPTIEAQPSTRSAESPTGLTVSLNVPQSWENPFSVATANLRDTTVTLPEGMTINPSAGSGLGACSPAQYEAETAESLPGEGCPPESKIGSIQIETPILNEKIEGAVYVATPYDNPFNALLSLYIVAKVPDRGIIVKVPGKIEPNPITGQLTTTFDNTPQQPFSKFVLKFRPGSTAPLVSPATCGAYAAAAALTPWSAPSEPLSLSSEPFQVTEGVREGACPSGGVPPFKPQVISGTQNNDAGSYSPFYLRIIREDGEQELTKFTTILPPGLSGNLSGIPFCSEAQIEAARNATGAQEINDPSCPAASEIGHTIVGAGVGTVLAQTPGKVYLAGPYHGAALSIVSITSATVGPFDLGTVVIRFALRINPITAQVEIDSNGSDPIPHIIDGIVVHVKDIRVYITRPDFILNPTNCDAMNITNTITGAGANPAVPADQETVGVSTHFEAADCSSLQFKPGLAVSTQAKTSGANGASLTASVTYPNAPQGTQADIASVKVELPKQLPSRLTTLQKACKASTFAANPAGCPGPSLIGHAYVATPILPEPLQGPAYFVSNGTAKFPELIIVLQGYGFTIDLHGETFISKAGVTSTTFAAVPDQPFSSFELTLPEGPYSALTSVGSLCKTNLQLPTQIVAQNGAEINQTTKITVTGCPKGKTATKKHEKKQDKKGKNKKGKKHGAKAKKAKKK